MRTCMSRRAFSSLVLLATLAILACVGLLAHARPDIDIAPMGSGGEINGGRVTLSWGFGAGAPLVTPENIAASERAEGIGGGAVESKSAIVEHFSNNWGKWLSGLATVASYVLVAQNNDFWPFTGGDGGEASTPPATQAGDKAMASNGGTATYGDGNRYYTAGGDIYIYEANAMEPTEGGE